MENKKTLLTYLGILIVGLILGYVFTVGGFGRGHYGGCMWGDRDEGRFSEKGNWDGSKKMGMGMMDMDDMMEGMMFGLNGKTGDAFDKAFLTTMIVHHEGAVKMAEAVLKESKRPELIQLANDIITAQNKEIDMMKGWLSSWFAQ